MIYDHLVTLDIEVRFCPIHASSRISNIRLGLGPIHLATKVQFGCVYLPVRRRFVMIEWQCLLLVTILFFMVRKTISELPLVAVFDSLLQTRYYFLFAYTLVLFSERIYLSVGVSLIPVSSSVSSAPREFHGAFQCINLAV